MKVALLDPGLVDTAGHHADVDLRIAQAFVAKGVEPIVYANSKITAACLEMFHDSKIQIEGLFQVGAYRRPWYNLNEKFSIWMVARNILTSLKHIPRADLWLWPTLTLHQFIATQWLQKQQFMIGCAWFDADMGYRCGTAAWTASTRRAHSEFALVTFDAPSTQHYSGITSGVSPRQLPVPFDGGPEKADRKPGITIGFFGSHRGERGGDILRRLVEAIKARGWQVRAQNNEGFPDVGVKDCVVIPPFVPDLAREMLRCDIVVWPSDPVKYRNKSSGIVFQAIACGLPIVVPSNCRPRLMLNDFGLQYPGFNEASVPQILFAIERTFARLEHYRQMAAKAAERWREQHGTARFVDSILALSN
ncbi:MAG TPA: glycosyltransferase [Aestuariivirgaceae bacterium]